MNVAEIWRYPVKSMAGERIEASDVGALGVRGDRAWGLRDLDSGKIVSAKSPTVGRALLSIGARLSDGGCEVQIGDRVFGSDGADALSAALSAHLGREVRFERATAADEMYESYWPEVQDMALSDVTADFPIAMSTTKGAFVDLAALHIVSTASMRALQALLPDAAIDVRRFRPNLVIDADGDAFVDNTWAGRTATVGTVEVSITSVAPRCIMTTLQQGDLAGDKRVLQTLSVHNRVDFAGFGNFACLGVYAEVVTPGVVTAGDPFVLH